MAAFTDARIAALKAGLELTPDQAKNWPAFEQAVRDAAQLRIQRMQEREARRQQQGQNAQGNAQATRQAMPKPRPRRNPFERMAHRADRMAKSSAALKKIADAGAPLYQSLTDDQKARFRTLGRMLQPHHAAWPSTKATTAGAGRGFRSRRSGLRTSSVWPERRRERRRAGQAALSITPNCGGAR